MKDKQKAILLCAHYGLSVTGSKDAVVVTLDRELRGDGVCAVRELEGIGHLKALSVLLP